MSLVANQWHKTKAWYQTMRHKLECSLDHHTYDEPDLVNETAVMDPFTNTVKFFLVRKDYHCKHCGKEFTTIEQEAASKSKVDDE